MVSDELISQACDTALDQMGKPYAIGGPVNGVWVVRGKPEIKNQNPIDFDCSGFVRWVIGQVHCDLGARITLPHGCIQQLKMCKKIPAKYNPRPLDLGFANFHGPEGYTDHVVICVHDGNVMEARGTPYNKVICRKVDVWNKEKKFLGWYEIPGIYD